MFIRVPGGESVNTEPFDDERGAQCTDCLAAKARSSKPSLQKPARLDPLVKGAGR
jgi:hypothetical protein